MVEGFVAGGAYEPLRVRVRTRRTHRGADGLDADRGEHRVKAGGELGVPVADKEPETLAGVIEVGREVPCDLGHPWAVWVGGDTEDVDNASLQLDHEQHVVPAEQHSVDMEEVGGHDALGLGGEELGPGGALTSGCRWETVPTQHHGDARLRHGDVEFLELADDPEVAPAGVPPSESADQLDGLVGKSRSSRSAVRVGPAPADHRTVPTEDGLRRDQERLPAFLRDKTSKQSDERSVAPGEAGTDDLAAKHGQLVAQDEDLGIFRRGIRPVDTEQPEDA